MYILSKIMILLTSKALLKKLIGNVSGHTNYVISYVHVVVRAHDY